MNPLKQLLDATKSIEALEKDLSRAKSAESLAKKMTREMCPVDIGDKVPLDSGGYGEVVRIRIMKIREDYVSFGVDVSKDGESHFLTMVPSRAVMDRLRG